MTTFTIESENDKIMLHTSAEEAATVAGAERFSSAEELAELAGNWSTARLIDIWNGLPGVAPVNKFKDKKTAVNRIWNAIQTLGADPTNEPVAASEPEPEISEEQVAPPVEVETETATPEPDANVSQVEPHVAPSEPEPTKKATRKAKTHTGEKVVKAPRAESKTSRVIEMLKREGGATLEEIMTEMGWQKHTTRAMLRVDARTTSQIG